MTIEEKLTFFANAGAGAAALLSSGDPMAKILGNQLVRDLSAWRAMSIEDTELAAGYEQLRTRAATAKAADSSLMAQRGPVLWEQLHRYCLEADRTQASSAAVTAWMRNWIGTIPCGSCKGKFAQIYAKNPPPSSDFFGWSVLLHNSVNVDPEVSKPQLSVAEAQARWV